MVEIEIKLFIVVVSLRTFKSTIPMVESINLSVENLWFNFEADPTVYEVAMAYL